MSDKPNQNTIGGLCGYLTAIGAKPVANAIRLAKTPTGHYRFGLTDRLTGPYTGDIADRLLEDHAEATKLSD